jgi:hypothetical protein
LIKEKKMQLQTIVADKNSIRELNDSELELVGGGMPVAMYAAAAAVWGAGYSIGQNIGKSLYYMLN